MEFLAENHPRVIHFAIAFLFAYPFVELLALLLKKDYLEKAAHLILLFGVLAATAAVITGNQAADAASILEEKGAIIPFGSINEHEEYATITLVYFTALLLLRTFLVLKHKYKGYLKYIIVVLAFIGAYLVFETGDHGGRLVYKFGVGTELKKMEIEE